MRFLGPEPALVNQSSATDPDDNQIASDTGTDPVVEFLWRNGDFPAGAGGFTWPTWQGFDSLPLATVTFLDPQLGTPMPEPFLIDMDQEDSNGPWGTPDDFPAPIPTHPDATFNGWLLLDDAGGSTPWSIGTPLYGDAVFVAEWVQQGPATVEAIEVRASAAEVIDGAQATFTEAGSRTITATHGDGAVDTLVIQVLPASSIPASSGEAAPGVLPDTGAGLDPWASFAAAVLLTLGLGLIVGARRPRVAGGNSLRSLT